jgi:hypothetical protein
VIKQKSKPSCLHGLFYRFPGAAGAIILHVHNFFVFNWHLKTFTWVYFLKAKSIIIMLSLRPNEQ